MTEKKILFITSFATMPWIPWLPLGSGSSMASSAASSSASSAAATACNNHMKKVFLIWIANMTFIALRKEKGFW